MRQVYICYPVPLQSDHNWEIFLPCALRFSSTWKQFPPGTQCTLAAVCLQNEPDAAVRAIFQDLPVEWFRYNGDGCDIGAALWLSHQLDDAFQVSMNSRIYFHRAGWLERLVAARAAHGPGLYGTCASRERRLHIRTACYGLDSLDLSSYQGSVNSREEGREFESGEWCLLDFVSMEIGWPYYLVTWLGVLKEEDWFNFPNGFRNGDQSNLLVWDEHVAIWNRASPEEKERLYKMCYEA